MPPLPPDALRVLAEQLDQGDLEQTLLLLKFFVVLCRWVRGPAEGGARWGRGTGTPGLCCPSLLRNLETVEAGWGQVLVPRVLALLTRMVAKVSGLPLGGGTGDSHHPADPFHLLRTPQLKGRSPLPEGQELEEVVALHALLLCEGLFDPYQTWRRQHHG